MLAVEQRAGLEAVNHQAADEGRGGQVTRNAEAHQRNQRTAVGGVVGSLRGADALGAAVAKLLRGLGYRAGEVVGDQCRSVLADTGQNADAGADHAADADGLPAALHLGERRN